MRKCVKRTSNLLSFCVTFIDRYCVAGLDKYVKHTNNLLLMFKFIYTVHMNDVKRIIFSCFQTNKKVYTNNNRKTGIIVLNIKSR